MGAWMRDVRYSARVLIKSPGFTLVAVLSLALGIGVNTAVLAVARAVLLQPLPVAEPNRLVVSYWSAEDVKGTPQLNSSGMKHPVTGKGLSSNYSYPMFLAMRERLKDSADVFAFTFMRQANISVEGRPVVGGGMLVSGSYFGGIGAPMALGRGLVPADDTPGAEPAAVIGHAFWTRVFGGDPAAVGRPIKINGRSFTVVGVTARGFFGVSNGGFFPPADVTLPLSAQPAVYPRWTPEGKSLFTVDNVLWLRIMARMKPGVTVAALEQEASGVFAQQVASSPTPGLAGAKHPQISLLPGAKGLDSLRRGLEKPIYMLGGVALLVFLIACLNLASLVLARGIARQQEFWVRLALGAGRARLVRQTLAESVLLAAAGGVLGLILAAWTGRALVVTLAGAATTAIDVHIEPKLFLISLAVSLVAALISGLLPALRLSANAASEFVRQAGAGRSALRLRAGRALVLVQVAVSVPLLVGAVLFLRTIHNLGSVALGFEPRNLVIFKMDPGLNGYDEARTKRLYEQVLDKLQTVPGVRSSTLLENALVSGWISNTRITVDGREPESILMNRVGPGFFDTIGMPIVAGRGIGIQDRDGRAEVAVINEAAATKLFGGAGPLGRQFKLGTDMVEVVGVARDSKYQGIKDAIEPTMFLPYFQSRNMSAMFVAVRTAGEGGVAERIRAAAAEVDREVAVTDLKTQSQQIDETIGSERAFTTLLVFFGVFALLLASIGLHGVTSYAVARRTSEIGIRMALGAQRGAVTWLILRQVVWLTIGGLVVGVPAALAVSRTARSYLYGIEPTDPVSVAAGAAVLFLIAVLAGYVPARKAARLDPLVALRRE
ncbi:MAG TPA: ABC transporter permease [Vicinamibacterales bacterium]